MSISTSRNGLSPRIWAREQAARIRRDSTGDWAQELVAVVEHDIPNTFADLLRQWEARAELFRLFRLTERAYEGIKAKHSRNGGGGDASFSGSVSINNFAVETKRELHASELQEKARAGGTQLESLPLLGQEGFIFRGLSHLVSGYPKAGKTELLARVVAEWRDDSVLWFTEEPDVVWETRLASLPSHYDHVILRFALGETLDAMRERILTGDESIVVIDTTKLLGLEDANDASEVTRVLTPIISACRRGRKTLILAHHERKGGGRHGEGIAGSHAFLGLVDVALEIARDEHAPNRRIITGLGRVVAIPELCYELQPDGSMTALGDPNALALEEVVERVRLLLGEEWQSLRDVLSAMGEPRPSEDQVRRALNVLVERGDAERDPPAGVKGNRAHRWRLRGSGNGDGSGTGSVSTAQSLVKTKRNEPDAELPFAPDYLLDGVCDYCGREPPDHAPNCRYAQEASP